MLTRQQIEQTEWYKIFKKEEPLQIEEAVNLILNPETRVEIFKTSEVDKKSFGCKDWTISVKLDINKPTQDGFWLETLNTKEEAIAFCYKMELVIQ